MKGKGNGTGQENEGENGKKITQRKEINKEKKR